MGILSNIGKWVINILPSAVKVVKKATEILHKTASVVDALLQGKKILFEDANQTQAKPGGRRRPLERPDIMGDLKSDPSEMLQLQKSIDEGRKKLLIIQETNELEHRRIQLQIDVMELVVSSSTFERFANNLNLHAANLQIHLHTIQNTAGLLDDVNHQRVAIKALMKTVNHLVNVLGVGDKVKKIEGMDIDIRPGAISIHKTYEAFVNTRKLLIDEVESFSCAIDDQMSRVENVRSSARHIPNVSPKVSSWLADSVEPTLIDAKKCADDLKGDLLAMPRLETNLHRELENAPQDAL